MASVVGICNTALSHIGDSANVSSIDPPDGSAQAGYCATFYPIALNALIEMAPWDFATTRAALALVTNPSSTWLYAYSAPSDVVNMISVLDSAALDDYSTNFTDPNQPPVAYTGYQTPFQTYSNPADNAYTPQPFATEIDSQGNPIILTNQINAVLRYTRAVNDPTQFSPLFVLALSYMLASLLAGPIIKGEPGATMAGAMLKMFRLFEAQAEASDANEGRILVKQSVPWMAGR